jgi:hypothetical protein
MPLTSFEIKSIGPMVRPDRTFARCDVFIGFWREDLTAVDGINLDIVIAYNDDEPIGALKSRLIAIAAQLLKDASDAIQGQDVQSLHRIADSNEEAFYRPNVE